MAKGAFLKSELAGQTMVALVILSYFENEKLFPSCLGFDGSGWIGLINSKILIKTGMSWPVSFDKWKTPQSLRETFHHVFVNNLYFFFLIKMNDRVVG